MFKYIKTVGLLLIISAIQVTLHEVSKLKWNNADNNFSPHEEIKITDKTNQICKIKQTQNTFFSSIGFKW
jgi:hypothetical protein